MKRMNCRALEERLMSADEAALLIEDSMTVAVSGFTPSGCPKSVPSALAAELKAGERSLRINILSGASTGPEIDDELAAAGAIARRYPYITSKVLRDMVNGRVEGKESVYYLDQHLGMTAQNAGYGFYGHIDIALIEASQILENGGIIPGTGLGCAQTWIDLADRVIIELNTALPEGLSGMHDIYDIADPPMREPIPLTSPGDRIGRTFLRCPVEKVAAVVVEERHEYPRPLASPDEISERIAGHIVRLLSIERAAGRLSAGQVPLQSGVGSVANAVLTGLIHSDFSGLCFYSEVLQDGVLDLMDSGQAVFASGTSLSLSEAGMRRLFENLDFYKEKIILRESVVSNSAEVIRRLGVISMNTAVEADIYGNINSSHMFGTDIYNGIGGSGDYARNAALTIFMTASTAKGGRISSIVPMVTHLDHSEHDTDIIVTEQGFADLRGKAPKERALLIIENCAHPDYRPQLRRYFYDACEASGYAQTPHILSRCFSFHERYEETGTMLES